MEVIKSKILKVTLFTVKYKSEAEIINHFLKKIIPGGRPPSLVADPSFLWQTADPGHLSGTQNEKSLLVVLTDALHVSIVSHFCELC